MIEKIEILQHSKGSHFGSHPCEEPWRLLCIVAYHHEMVIQLGEYGLNSLSDIYDNILNSLETTKLLKIKDMCYFFHERYFTNLTQPTGINSILLLIRGL